METHQRNDGCWKICKNAFNVATNTTPSLCHKRLNHMCDNGLQVLAKKNYIPFAKGTLLDPYGYFLVGK